jgi:hypothetical protein
MTERKEEVGAGANIFAVDSNADNISPIFIITRLDYRKALEMYKPQIVLCAWMPHETERIIKQ